MVRSGRGLRLLLPLPGFGLSADWAFLLETSGGGREGTRLAGRRVPFFWWNSLFVGFKGAQKGQPNMNL